ncbi:MAG: elongation factor P [Sphingomonadaceae bacterium]
MQFAPLCLALPLVLAALPAYASQGGKLETLPQGRYTCALPGDALGKAFVVLPDKAFVIDNGSTYRTETGSGTYLLTGTAVQFTRGPMKGMRFERVSGGTLRWLDEDGQPSRVRCVRAVR